MFTKEFQGTGSFQAIWAAEKWLKERGLKNILEEPALCSNT